MQVNLVAYTVFRPGVFESRYDWSPEIGAVDADALSEAAGRISYGSWSRPNSATATNVTYLLNILRQGHESIFEHSSATFLVSGVSRDMLLQLERHRHTSYSVRSQRYQDESKGMIADYRMEDHAENDSFLKVEAVARREYQKLIEVYEARGWSRKRARERARLVLPGGWETEFLVTANLRAWRYIINLRGSEHADAQIRTFTLEVAAQLQEYAPNAMQDVEFYTFEDKTGPVACVRIKRS